MMSHLRLAAALFTALLPSAVKVLVLRALFGYTIGNNVRIGLSLFADLGTCSIGDGTRIGHGNVFLHIEELNIGAHSEIGHFNLFRGGRSIRLGSFAIVRYRNVLNSIVDPDLSNAANPECVLADGAVVTNGHWLDFTDRIYIGVQAVIGGRASSLWTHSRQRTRPITIGNHTYVGSGVSMAPGTMVADCCIVALGAVLMDRFTEPRMLIAGNPGHNVHSLRQRDFSLVARATRRDMPRDISLKALPEDLHPWVDEANSTCVE